MSSGYDSVLRVARFDLIKDLELSPTGMICGCTIRWTDFNGNRYSHQVDGYFTPREARKASLRGAIRQGWTYPRWWQWWRWDDTRPDLDFS